MLKFIALLIIQALLVCVGVSVIWDCSSPSESSHKSPRAYVWTSTIISHPQSRQIWLNDIGKFGSTAWAVGQTSASPQATIWWNKGERWVIAPFHSLNGGPISGFVRFASLIGFDEQRVFVAGTKVFDVLSSNTSIDSAFVLQFDHGNWIAHLLPGRALYCAGGTGPSNIWVGGQGGTLLHFDGSLWVPETTDATTRAGTTFECFYESIAIDQLDHVLLVARLAHRQILGVNLYYLYRKTANGWSVIDSASNETPSPVGWGYYRLMRLPSGDVYSSGDGVYHWTGNGWISSFQHSSTTGSLFGSSPSNLFVTAEGPVVYHFDGQSWAELVSLSGMATNFSTGFATEGEAFLISYQFDANGTSSIIFSGK